MARTNSKHWAVFTVVSAFAAILVNACTGTTTNNYPNDSGGGGTVVLPDGAVVGCAPGAKECVNTSLARICPADGSGWLSQECKVGEKCDKGDCVADATALCAPGSGACVSATTGLRCRDNLMGFAAVTCPAGTTCQGDGLCAGSCIVGSSACLPDGTLATCVNGNTFTPTACAANERCVDVSTSPYPVSACKPADCTPDANGCDFVCGNKADATADQTKFTSTCVPTPTGYKWVALGCGAGLTCNPSARVCGVGRTQAACASDCTPGQSRCSADLLSTQICGPDGKWGAATACNANPAAAALICQRNPTNSSTVLCGDPLCATGAVGTCDTTGLRRCGPDGKLAATGTACATGSCVAVGTSVGTLAPGACVAECQAGDERCTASGATSYQTCANGRWATPVACPSADGGAAAATCFDYLSSTTQRPAKICGGVCAPGFTRCVSADGGPSTDAIETCNATGQWVTPATPCTVGACTAGVAGAGAACVAQCVPNAVVCVGAGKDVTGTPFRGTDTFGTCTAQGTLPTAGTTLCTGTAVCRRGAAGAIAPGGNACIECVGSSVAGGNERGTVDTRCSDPTGTTAGNADVQTCSAGNTWTGGMLDCVASAKTCRGAATSGPPIDTCNTDRAGFPRSESYWRAGGQGHSRRGPGPFSCVSNARGRNQGPPTVCGATPDCCSFQCNRATYTPAACR
jgi:hypothetical protein